MEAHAAAAGPSATTAESEDDDSVLAKSEYLTRQEVLKRRLRRLRRLTKCYRDHYWSLMEDVRQKHRDYIWKYGKDPYYNGENDAVEAEINGGGGGVVVGDTVNNSTSRLNNGGGGGGGGGGDDVSSSGRLGLGLGIDGGSFNWCSFPKCPQKAMALTNYCFSHILSDSKQVLYTRCQFMHKCGEDRMLCVKPVLRSTVPCMCPKDMKTAELNVRKALKTSGASGAASKKLATKFHVVLTEYVRHIQTRRRARRAENLQMENGAP